MIYRSLGLITLINSFLKKFWREEFYFLNALTGMNLDSWIFCWLLPVDCSMICCHLRMKQSQSFSQDQIFYCLPSAPSCCLHISDTSLSKHFQFQVVQWLSFSVCIIARAGCVSAPGTGGCGCVSVLFWGCACMWWSRTWALLFCGPEREWAVLRLLGKWFSAVGTEMLAGRGNSCILSGETLKMPMCCQSVSSLPRVWWTNPKPGLN